MDNLGFKPEEGYVLASIKNEDDDGNIDGIIRAIHKSSELDLHDDVHLVKGKYDRVAISGVDCILFKESNLLE